MSHSSVIPRHMTAEVGSISTTHGRYYLLWRDSQTIVIQAPAANNPYHRQLTFGLEIIQTLLGTVRFGYTNWAYLIEQGENNYRLYHRNRPIRRINCRIWAPLVDESDLEITVWVTFHRYHAIWKGKEVDVCIAWEDTRAWYVEEETNGRSLLVGLDLTFEVLGHIIRDGEVVGIMLEPCYGRPLRHDDRAVVYEAVAKMQSRRLFFPMIDNSNIMISEGKVRFMGVKGITRIATDSTGRSEEEVIAHHWQKLSNLFDTLDSTPYICQQNRLLGQHAIIIPKLPSPDRPFLSAFELIIQFKFYTPTEVLRWSDSSIVDEYSRRRAGKKRMDPDTPPLIAPAEQFNVQDEKCGVDQDPPLNERDIAHSSSVPTKFLLPNGRPDGNQRCNAKFLLAPDGTTVSGEKVYVYSLSGLSHISMLNILIDSDRPLYK